MPLSRLRVREKTGRVRTNGAPDARSAARAWRGSRGNTILSPRPSGSHAPNPSSHHTHTTPRAPGTRRSARLARAVARCAPARREKTRRRMERPPAAPHSIGAWHARIPFDGRARGRMRADGCSPEARWAMPSDLMAHAGAMPVDTPFSTFGAFHVRTRRSRGYIDCHN